MIKSVTINGKNYDIEDGLVYKATATEELDSATFQIKNTTEIDLEPTQEVVITFANDKKIYHIINTWVDEPATFDTDLKNYTISTISKAKLLERVLLPNLTITQPLNLKDDEKRNYRKYIEMIYALYIEKQFPKFTLDVEMLQKMQKIIAVEEQFNSLNAKEYLNQVFEKINSIVTIKENVITTMDLSKKGKPIDESKLFFTSKHQQINDYYNKIYTDLQNVQSEDASVITEIVGMRAPESAVLTTDNGIIKLSHNINQIKKLVVYAKCEYSNPTTHQSGTQVITFNVYGDKYKYVKEKAEYDLLRNSNILNEFDSDMKRMNLYFTRGSNTIEGLLFTESQILGSQSRPAIVMILTKMGSDSGLMINLAQDVRELKFEVTYSAVDDVSVSFEKSTTNINAIRDNQSESYVDLNKFAKAEQEKINRLGVETKPITARYFSLNEVPQLMDYIGDYYLAEIELAIHNDYIDFKGVLYKDYVKKNMFYGVNAKRRTTQLITGSEAVTRKELIKTKCVFSFSNKATGVFSDLARYLLGRIVSTNYRTENMSLPNFLEKEDFTPIKLVYAESYLSDGSLKAYKLEPDVRKAYNSVCVNLKWNDNYSVGMKIGNIKELGGYGQEYVSYVDNNGELDSLFVAFFDKYSVAKDNFNEVNNYPYFDISNEGVDFNNMFFNNYVEIYKDNKEILNLTYQFEFVTEENIFITERFIDMTPFFDKPKQYLYIWISNDEKYDRFNKDKVLASSTMIVNDLEIDYTDLINFSQNKLTFNRIMLYNNNVDLTNVKSWALADGNGNVYLAVNKRPQDEVIRTTIYLNHK